MKPWIGTLALALALTAVPSLKATTCAADVAHIPAGVVVTPSCTYIVQQLDTNEWLDNLGALWAWVAGWPTRIGQLINVSRP